MRTPLKACAWALSFLNKAISPQRCGTAPRWSRCMQKWWRIWRINLEQSRPELCVRRNNLKAVLFDLDGTLLPMDMEIFLREYLQKLGVKAAAYGYDPAK